jgi:lysE family translocator protein
MSLIALVTAWFAAIALPGPDLFQIMRLGTHDRRAGVMCAIGIMLGNSLWIISSLVGLSAAIAALPGALLAIQIIGGCYITWIGISSLRSGLQKGSSGHAIGGRQAVSTIAALRIGILTNLSNPKAVVFFAAIFAQFIRPDAGVWWSVFIAALLIITGFGWFVGFALGVNVIGEKLLTNTKIIDLTAGTVFLVLGCYMLVSGLMAL